MRDSQLVIASKYNPCSNILSEGCAVCFHKPEPTHMFTLSLVLTSGQFIIIIVLMGDYANTPCLMDGFYLSA